VHRSRRDRDVPTAPPHSMTFPECASRNRVWRKKQRNVNGVRLFMRSAELSRSVDPRPCSRSSHVSWSRLSGLSSIPLRWQAERADLPGEFIAHEPSLFWGVVRSPKVGLSQGQMRRIGVLWASLITSPSHSSARAISRSGNFSTPSCSGKLANAGESERTLNAGADALPGNHARITPHIPAEPRSHLPE
jgi:hypothetical protein